MKTTNYLILAATLTFTACSNADEPALDNNQKPVAAQVTANISENTSRAYDNQWETGDKIGISTTSTGKTKYSNMQYNHTGSGVFSHNGGDASGIFFQDKQETVAFSAYYPFNGTEGTSADAISADTQDQTKQKEFDFLYATATASSSTPEVNFAFTHKMTRMILNITTDPNSGFNATDVRNGKFYLNGIKHSGNFNTATGETKTSGDATDSWEITAAPTNANNMLTYSTILFPQTNPTLIFKAVIDGQDYACNLTSNLDAGKSYTYTITIKKTGLTVSNCSISNWSDGGEINGNAVIQ